MLSRKRTYQNTSNENIDNLTDDKPVAMQVKKQKVDSIIGYAAMLYSLDSAKSSNIELPAKQTIKIGRSKSKQNDIIIKSADCSSIHCEFIISPGLNDNNSIIITVKDLSSNGTYLNDILIGKNNSTIIRDGDKISFASNMHYILKYKNNNRSKNNKQSKSFFDKYILTDKLLGTGHYAQVKEAIDRESGKICAVKIFNPTNNDNDNNQSIQLNRELNILTKLNHKNIVGFYSTFLEPVSRNSLTTYLVLEKVNGGELFNRIIKKGKLSQNESKEITRQLLEGLIYLHSMDLVHRDLKPENILLDIKTCSSKSLEKIEPWDLGELQVNVKIADFGLAKFIGKLQFTNTLCGTPAYVAPEVLVNSQLRKYNKSVDMWSVGVLLYVCICGFPPFSEELGPPSMRNQILEGKFAFYSPYWDEIDDLILDLISRLLVVDPNKRLTAFEALNHHWFNTDATTTTTNSLITKNENIYDDMISLRARQLSIRIPSSSRGYSCEPIGLKQRVESKLNDEKILQTFCVFNKNVHKGERDIDGDTSMN